MITIEEQIGPSPEVEALLKSVTYGTPGGFRYNVLDRDWSRLKEIRLLLARDGSRLVGCYGLLPRSWGYYTLLYVVHHQWQGKGVGQQLLAEVDRRYRSTLAPGQVLASVVEGTNQRTLNKKLKAGFEIIGQFEALTFFRRFPRKTQLLDHPTEEEFEAIQRDLLAHDKSWLDISETTNATQYWVLRQQGKIVAGIRACTQRWAVGGLGKTLRFFRPLLPLLGLPLDDYRFLSFHYPWGDAAYASRLFEAVLAQMGVKSAMVYGDPVDPDWQHLRAQLRRGLLGSILGAHQLCVTGTGSLPRPFVYPSWASP